MTNALFDIEQGSPSEKAPTSPSAPASSNNQQSNKAPAPLFSLAPLSSETATPAPLFALAPSPAPAPSAPAPLFAIPTSSSVPPVRRSSNSAQPPCNGSNNKPPPLFQISTTTTTPTKDTTSTAPPPLFQISTTNGSSSNSNNNNHDHRRKESSSSTKSESEEGGNCNKGDFGGMMMMKNHNNSHNHNDDDHHHKTVMLLPSNLEKEFDDEDDNRSDGAVQPQQQHHLSRAAARAVRPAKSSSSDGDSSTHSSNSISSLAEQLRSRTGLIVALIVILGVGASAAFWAIGLSGAERQQSDQFQRSAKDLATSIQTQFERYVTAANYVHHYCRNRSFTRGDFRSLYEYLIEDGLDFKAVQFDPNVTREERAQYETEARAYYAEHYPHIDYQGFKGFDNGVKNGLVPTSERDFYFPIHYMEPIIGNEAAIDLDYYSHISRRRTLSHCFEFGEPAITDRLLLVKDPNAVSRCGSQDAESYGVVLMHPGVNVSDPEASGGIWPRDLSSIVLCIPALLLRSTLDHPVASKVYIHDAHDSSGEVLFLGGVEVYDRETGQELTYLKETELKDVKGHMQYQEHLKLTNKIWTITVVAPDEVYKPTITFVVVGGTLVFLASVCLALWVYTNTQRHNKFNTMKAKVEGEKAALILENTRQAARAERELNDFIAHEVRNPVAAAMAACSFVKSAVNEKEPLVDPQKREDTREDVAVIYNSLQFINDLLRNMLDMHRASHKQLQVNFEAVDLYHDILQSTAGMIYQRDSKIKVIVECEPQQLFVRSDCLRLKQVILNLSRNATKFVSTGFIKLRGFVVDNEVRLAVEDSGIGIPAEKRDLLFAKFQESLDQLSQGTGIGLYLCKNLVELMGGEIYLNKEYDSGVPGNPGTSIEINLKRPPVSGDDVGNEFESADESAAGVTFASSMSNSQSSHDFANMELPEHLNVLFVDDDNVLRKLFARSVKRVAPQWTMREASNGESALQLIDQGLKFDLIFVDQYMASIEKQLLGTETILEMRAHGETCRLFGLSANDLEAEFIAAGADGFIIKPFPTESHALKQELLKAVYGKRAYYAKR